MRLYRPQPTRIAKAVPHHIRNHRPSFKRLRRRQRAQDPGHGTPTNAWSCSGNRARREADVVSLWQARHIRQTQITMNRDLWPQRPHRKTRGRHSGPTRGLWYPTSSSLRCSKEQGKWMLLFYCFFDKRERTTGSKAKEEVGWLTTPCLWGHQARKPRLRSRRVQRYPRGSRRITLLLHIDGGRGGVAARRRASLLLHRRCKTSVKSRKCSRGDCNGKTCPDPNVRP